MKYLDYKVALDTAFSKAHCTQRFEKVPLLNCIGRILAKDVLCIKNIPSFDNSAMDGFAFNFEDINKQLKVVGVIFAGDEKNYCLNNNEAYKIMTGAKMPKNADTIIPVENTNGFDENYVSIPNNIKKGSNFRVKGEDYSLNEKIFSKGQNIDANMISVFASQGISVVDVYTKLNIAILSTGNELKEPWEFSSENEIYNSNSAGIIAILNQNNFNANYLGVVPDNLEETTKFFNSLKSYDLIISTGGISMGDADFVAKAYENNGLEVFFHGVNVKPGRPTMMGKMNDTFIMAMPGNPLTALINTHLFALPIIYKLSGSLEYYHDFVYAKNIDSFKVKKNRANIVLGELKAGEFNVSFKNKYGSGSFSPIVQSNSVMISLEGVDEFEKNKFIKVIPLDIKLQKNNLDIYNK